MRYSSLVSRPISWGDRTVAQTRWSKQPLAAFRSSLSMGVTETIGEPPQLPGISEVITEAVEGFTELFFSNSVSESVLIRFGEVDLEILRSGLSTLLTMALDPEISDADVSEFCDQIARAHAMVGISSLVLMRLLPELATQLTESMGRLDMDSKVVTSYVGWAASRVAGLVTISLEVEAEFDRGLHELLDGLTETCRTSNTSPDLARQILARLASLSGVCLTFIARPNAEGNLEFEHMDGSALEIMAENSAKGKSAHADDYVIHLSEVSPGARAWLTGSVLLIPAVSMEPSLVAWQSFYEAIGARSIAAVPILDSNNRPRALLGVYSKWPGYFDTPSRKSFIEYVRQLLAGAMERLDGGGVMSYGLRQHFHALLEDGRVRMLFQPIVHLNSGALEGVEALARLVDVDDRIIPPAEFLLALDSDDLLLLFKIGVEQSISALKAWRADGLNPKVSINFPIQGLADGRYVKFLQEYVVSGKLEPKDFALELTEEQDTPEGAGSYAVLEQIKAMGFKIAQDDLGAGYSSLSRLERIRFDEVKIDQALVRTSSDPQNSLPLIEHLTHLAHDLGITVVVEGLETEALIEASRIIGADLGQGYAIAKPMEPEKLLNWVSAIRWNSQLSRPRTALGALAALRSWTQRVRSMASYPEILVDPRLISELRDALLYQTDPRMRGQLDQLGKSLKIGVGAEYRANISNITYSLLTLLDVSSVARESLDVFDPDVPHRNDESLTRDELRTLLDVYDSLVKISKDVKNPEQVIVEVCKLAESYVSNTVASVMELSNSGTLEMLAGPSFGESLAKAFENIVPGPYAGSCGTAVHLAAPVIVGNTAVDPRWRDFQATAAEHNLRACWSFPLVNSSGRVQGTFALTSFENRMPSRFQRVLLEACTEHASLALSRLEEFRDHQAELARQADAGAGRFVRFSVRVRDGAISNVSDEARAFYGFTDDEWARINIFDLNVKVTPDLLNQLADSIELGGFAHMTATHRLASGELREVEFYTRLRVTDGERFLDSSFIDITDRSLSERLLAGETAIRDRILNTGAFIAMVIDPLGVTLSVNELVTEILGVQEIELHGRLFPWEKAVTADGVDAILQTSKHAVLTKESHSTEVWFKRADGESRRFTLRASPVFDSDGALSSLVYTGIDTTDRYEAETQVRSQKIFVSQIIESLSNLVIVLDSKGRVVECNKALEEFAGMTLQQMSAQVGVSLGFFAPSAREYGFHWFEQAVIGKIERRASAPWIDKDGNLHDMDWHSSTIPDADGNVEFIVCIGVDVTDEKKRNDELALAAVVFKNAREGIVITDQNGLIVDVNAGYCRISGYDRSECVGQNAGFWRSGQHDSEFYAAMYQELNLNGFWSGTIWNRGRNGGLIPILMQITAIAGVGGSVGQYVGICTEITEMIEYQDRLSDLAFHDLLTGLPNRSLLAEQIKHAIASSKRDGRILAVAYMDLDNFKPINDTYGHAEGDRLLVQVAKRMSGALRDVDTIARIGGDEFVCLLPDLTDEVDAKLILGRLSASFEEPIWVGNANFGEYVTISSSIGVVFTKGEEVDPDTLLRQADQLMYRAKRLGGGCHVTQQDFAEE